MCHFSSLPLGCGLCPAHSLLEMRVRLGPLHPGLSPLELGGWLFLRQSGDDTGISFSGLHWKPVIWSMPSLRLLQPSPLLTPPGWGRQFFTWLSGPVCHAPSPLIHLCVSVVNPLLRWGQTRLWCTVLGVQADLGKLSLFNTRITSQRIYPSDLTPTKLSLKSHTG